MCFNWVHYQRLALSSKCSLHCLIYENGPGLFKYLFLCHLTRCQILSVEGAGETLQEERVVLPASSVLIYRLLQCLEGPRLLRDTQPLQHRSLQGRGTRDTQRLAASPAPLQGVLQKIASKETSPCGQLSFPPEDGKILASSRQTPANQDPTPQSLHHKFSTLQVLIGYLWNELYSQSENTYWCVCGGRRYPNVHLLSQHNHQQKFFTLKCIPFGQIIIGFL